MSKRFLAGLLMLVMVLGTICVPAFAADAAVYTFTGKLAFADYVAGETTNQTAADTAIASNAADPRVAWGSNFTWRLAPGGTYAAQDTAVFNSYLIMKSSNIEWAALHLEHNDAARMNIKTVNVTGRAAKQNTEVVRFAISADQKSYYEFGFVGTHFESSTAGSAPSGAVYQRPYVAKVIDGTRTVLAAASGDSYANWEQWKDTHYDLSISGNTITYTMYQTAQGTNGPAASSALENTTFTGTIDDTNEGLMADFVYPIALTGCTKGGEEVQYRQADFTYTKDKEPVQAPQVFSCDFDYADYTYPTTTNLAAEGISSGMNAETNKADLRVAWGNNYTWHFTDGYSTLEYPSQDYVGFNSGGRLIMKGANVDLLALTLEHDDAPYMVVKSITTSGRAAKQNNGMTTEIVRVALSADKNTYYEFGLAGEYFDNSSTMPTGITQYRPFVARVVNGTRTVLAAASGDSYADWVNWQATHYEINVDGSTISYKMYQDSTTNSEFTGTVSDSGFGLLNTFAYPVSLAGYTKSGGEAQYNNMSLSYTYGAKAKSFTEDWTAFTAASAKTEENTDGNCLNFFSSDTAQTVVPGTEINVAWADDYTWKFATDGTNEASTGKIYMRPDDAIRRTVIIGDAAGAPLTLVHKDGKYMNIESVAVDSLFSRSAGQGVRIAINSDEDTYYELGMNNDTQLPYAAVVKDGSKTVLATGTTVYTGWARIHYQFSVSGNTITYKMYQTEQNGTAEIANTEFTGTISDATYGILAGAVYPVALVGYNSSLESQFEGVSIVYTTDLDVIDQGTTYRVSANTSGMDLSQQTITLVMAVYVEEDGALKLIDVDYQESVIGSTPVNFAKSSTAGAIYKIFVLDGDMASLTPAARAREVE